MSGDLTLPLAAVLAHWQPAQRDASWAQAVDDLWRKEPERMAALDADIRATGQIRKPIVLGIDGRVWDGHHRLAVACLAGRSTVPVVFAALGYNLPDGCPTCGLPTSVHTLWCPARPAAERTADDVVANIHAVFADPSRSWFAEQFWAAYAQVDAR